MRQASSFRSWAYAGAGRAAPSSDMKHRCQLTCLPKRERPRGRRPARRTPFLAVLQEKFSSPFTSKSLNCVQTKRFYQIECKVALYLKDTTRDFNGVAVSWSCFRRGSQALESRHLFIVTAFREWSTETLGSSA